MTNLPESQRALPPIEKIHAGGRLHLVQRLGRDGVVNAETSHNLYFFDINWPSDLGPSQVIESCRQALDDFSGSSGYILYRGQKLVTTHASDVITLVLADPEPVTAFRTSGLAMELSWHEPRKANDGNVDAHGEVELCHMIERDIVQQLMAATAIEGMQGHISAILDEFSVDIPALRQA